MRLTAKWLSEEMVAYPVSYKIGGINKKSEGRQICEMTRKLCYSQKETRTIANANSTGHQKKHFHKVPVRAYFCENCRQYHLASKQ